MTHPHNPGDPVWDDREPTMIGGFEGVSHDDDNFKVPPPSVADKLGAVAAWLIGALLMSIFIGGLFWVAVRIWKDIPW